MSQYDYLIVGAGLFGSVFANEMKKRGKRCLILEKRDHIGFEHEYLSKPNYQGNAVVNYTEKKIPYTRIIEHKHFEFGKQSHTVLTREYSCKNDATNEPYYPINDERNNRLFNQYKAMTSKCSNVIFGGRLAEFKYYDMHQVIASALAKAAKEDIFCNV